MSDFDFTDASPTESGRPVVRTSPPKRSGLTPERIAAYLFIIVVILGAVVGAIWVLRSRAEALALDQKQLHDRTESELYFAYERARGIEAYRWNVVIDASSIELQQRFELQRSIADLPNGGRDALTEKAINDRWAARAKSIDEIDPDWAPEFKRRWKRLMSDVDAIFDRGTSEVRLGVAAGRGPVALIRKTASSSHSEFERSFLAFEAGMRR